MASPNTKEAGDGCCEEHFPFLDLPPELMLKVCDYLSSTTIINTLSKVCLYLSQLVGDNLIWRTRVRKRWPGKKYPPVADQGEFNWREACMVREVEYKRWSDYKHFMARTNIRFNACVDVVHITENDSLVVGLRDHTLCNFSIREITKHQPEEAFVEELNGNDLTFGLDIHTQIKFSGAHKGWIWTINSDAEKMISGGWDSKVFLWDSSGQQISEYQCKSAVLSSTMNGNEIYAGTFNKTLVQIDSRANEPICFKRAHPKAVLCVQRTDDWILTGSESKLIHIFDKRTLKICNTAKLDVGYPRSMTLIGNTMYVGSSTGAIHLYEFNAKLGSLTLVETFEDQHAKEVRSIQFNRGAVISASKDGICKVWEPSCNPAQLCNINLHTEICKMDYRNQNLAFGLSSGTVSLLYPSKASFE